MRHTHDTPTGISPAEEDILRSIPDVVLRYDGAGILGWASPSLFHVFGYRPEDVVGTAFRLSHPDDRTRVFEAVHQLEVNGRTTGTARYPALRADGTTTMVEARARAEYDGDDGTITHLVAVVREVSGGAPGERLYRLLADNTTDVVLVYDAASVLIWASPSTTRTLGHEPSDLIGSPRTVLHPDDVQAARDLFAKALAENAGGLRNRARVRRADGSYLWMDVSVAIVWAESGELEYAITSLHDVHNEVVAEENLRTWLARFQLLVENSLDVVYQVDEQGRLTWVSPNITALLGWQPEDLVGRVGLGELTYIHPDDAGPAEAVRHQAAPGTPITLELRLRTEHGEYRWVEASAVFGVDEHGTPTGVGVLRDVQGRHEAQAALSASESLFRSAMRDSAVGMCLITTDGRIMVANQALCEFLARSEDELTVLSWPEVADPAELKEDRQTLAEILAGRLDAWRGIRHFKRADASVVSGDVTVSAIRGDAGEVDRLLVQIIDVTEQIRMQQQLALSEEHYRLLADSVSDVVLRSDEAGIITWASRSLEHATGMSPEQVVGLPLLDLVHPHDVETVLHTTTSAAAGSTAHIEIRLVTGDGTHKWFAVVTSPFRGPDGRASGRVATARDIGDEVATRRLLAQREAEFREIAEHAADMVLRMDAEDRMTWASPSIREVVGYSSSEVLGRDPKEFIHPEDIEPYREWAHALEPNIPARATLRVRCADGDYRWFSVIATRVFDPDAVLVSQIVGMRNIDVEVRAVEALARSEEQFRLAMDSAPGGMAVVDLEGGFVEANQSLGSILGRERGWLLEHGLRDVVHADDWPKVQQMHEVLISGQTPASREEIRLQHAGGSTVWVESSLAALREQHGRPVSFVAQFIDVTQAREARAALRHAATHDPLTLLDNRRGLAEDLESIVHRSPRTGTGIGVLAVDLDGLKPVNDRYGHAAGDEVLVAVGERLRTAVRKDDPIARTGGDEFVVILVAVHNLEQVALLAERVRDCVAEEIVLSSGLVVHVTSSVGAVLAGPDDDADGLLRRADAALYEAKQSCRDRVVVKTD